jgi:hypothetical protein
MTSAELLEIVRAMLAIACAVALFNLFIVWAEGFFVRRRTPAKYFKDVARRTSRRLSGR